MSSLVTQMIVAEKYGPRLSIEQLASVLGITKGAVYNQISAGTFPIATYMDGGKRWADYRAVAEHLDDCALRASAAGISSSKVAVATCDTGRLSRAAL